MNRILIAVAIALVTLNSAEAGTSANRAFMAQSAPLVEFRVKQNFSLQTVTCKQYFGLGDFNNGQVGHLDGTNCTSTGPMLLEDGDTGRVALSFSFTDGSNIEITGCSFDTETFSPGYFSYSFNCTHN